MQISDRLVDLISETTKGIQFYKASSYNKAMDFLKTSEPPNTIILDWELSGSKSVDILKKIREVNEKAVIIVLSVYQDPNTQVQCKKFKVDFLLDKYHEFEKIPALIKSETEINP